MEEEDSKMAKQVEISKEETKNNNNNSGSKFGKLWSEEDEISLLSGYYEYQHQKKGKSDVCGWAGGFYEFIKHRLRRSCVKQSQVSDKICRLKKKYMEHASKYQDNNNNPLLHVVDPHLQKLFQLSRKIWCVDGTDHHSNTNITNNTVDEDALLSPSLSTEGVKFDLSNDFVSQEFFDFLYFEGVDVDLLDTETVITLKRKFGEVELCRSRFEYKQAKLSGKFEKLKYDRYKRALDKFF